MSNKEVLIGLLTVPPIEEVHEKVRAAWHLGKRFPVPKFKPTCPCCQSEDVIFRRMRFFLIGGPATTPYRCDVFVKCGKCSAAWTYGIVIPKEMYEANQHVGQIHRKDILAELKNMSDV